VEDFFPRLFRNLGPVHVVLVGSCSMVQRLCSRCAPGA
jgi:hypothetical protein